MKHAAQPTINTDPQGQLHGLNRCQICMVRFTCRYVGSGEQRRPVCSRCRKERGL